MTDVDRPTIVEVGGEPLWTREIHGHAGHNPLFHPAGTGLYVSDGWGRRIAAALRFRRLDIPSGAETGAWPCGSAVRCLVALDAGDLLVATDLRLARLDPITLAERRRWDKSVRHATALAERGGVAVAGNPVTPTVSVVDLGTGEVRRRRAGPVAAILGRDAGDPLLVGGPAGGLTIVDPVTAAVRKVRSTPPAMAAALSGDGQGVWLIPGTRVHVTEHAGGASLRAGDGATRVEWHPMADGIVRVVKVPLPVRTIAVGPDALWLTPSAVPGTEQYVLIGGIGDGPWRVWRPPESELVEVVAPNPGLVVTRPRRSGSDGTAFTCHRIGG